MKINHQGFCKNLTDLLASLFLYYFLKPLLSELKGESENVVFWTLKILYSLLEPKDIMNTNCVSISLSRASRVTKCCLELIPRSPCQNCLCVFRFNIRRNQHKTLSAVEGFNEAA